jgi:hypothetical protein
MPQEQGGHAQNHDEAFRQATKVVVDDALRIDVLGPRIVAVLCDHTPASDKPNFCTFNLNSSQNQRVNDLLKF